VRRGVFYDDNGHRWVTVGQEQTEFAWQLPSGGAAWGVSAGDRGIPPSEADYGRSGFYLFPFRQKVHPVDHRLADHRLSRPHAGEELHFELRPAVSPTHTVTTTESGGGGGRDFMRISARSSSGIMLQVNPQMKWRGRRDEDTASAGDVYADGEEE